MVLTVGNASIKYGSFITSIVDFLIIAFSIFIALKYINKLNRIKEFGEEAAIKFDKEGRLKKVIIICSVVILVLTIAFYVIEHFFAG